MSGRGWRVLVLVLVATSLGLTLALVTANRSARLASEAATEAQEARETSEQQLCLLVIGFDEAYREAPPQTPAGRRVADTVAALRRIYGCPS
ncbi:hypothetical protein [Micromonospora cathayae]|uniref:Uncharacterized protein n=1 Tax=Micromonospora cathayae TaxID=3028804 RepID=A0ABY7ZXQ4_9ACTN|nr:hypothetical protein [Micromonospora sp. HUAS 3]WDZ87176.1 hypothetical protein PVK37_12610 [Micromonospora sp. HUAS 3]